MKNSNKINTYLLRINEELSYKNYANARELCVRILNLDNDNLCARCLRDFIELHKKSNGRYSKLTVCEFISYLYTNRNKITSDNLQQLETYLALLYNEIPNGVGENVEDLSYETKQNLSAVIRHLESVVETAESNFYTLSKLTDSLKFFLGRIEKVLEEREKELAEREMAYEKEMKRNRIIRMILRFLLIVCLIVFIIYYFNLY